MRQSNFEQRQYRYVIHYRSAEQHPGNRGILEEDFRDRILPFDRPSARAYAAIAAIARTYGASVACHRPWPISNMKVAAMAHELEVWLP